MCCYRSLSSAKDLKRGCSKATLLKYRDWQTGIVLPWWLWLISAKRDFYWHSLHAHPPPQIRHASPMWKHGFATMAASLTGVCPCPHVRLATERSSPPTLLPWHRLHAQAGQCRQYWCKRKLCRVPRWLLNGTGFLRGSECSLELRIHEIASLKLISAFLFGWLFCWPCGFAVWKGLASTNKK